MTRKLLPLVGTLCPSPSSFGTIHIQRHGVLKPYMYMCACPCAPPARQPAQGGIGSPMGQPSTTTTTNNAPHIKHSAYCQPPNGAAKCQRALAHNGLFIRFMRFWIPFCRIVQTQPLRPCYTAGCLILLVMRTRTREVFCKSCHARRLFAAGSGGLGAHLGHDQACSSRQRGCSAAGPMQRAHQHLHEGGTCARTRTVAGTVIRRPLVRW